ncbi:hypothetical protein [Arenimonas sp. GDDSR-1]|uniref:hypothetical protein n=1 Tax=Arenimonas sp. GDDSR-1 TaxID=2950125 RepID=UPI0026276AD9|nr:hypothetical protein [Arenimonas sp. GDDSR-1]
MNNDMNDDIDALLHRQFEGPVPDNGFSDSVMGRLPAPPRRSRWPLLVGSLSGIAVCWLSLRSAPIVHAAWQDWLSGQASAPALALFASMAGMAMLAFAWAVAEADERPAARP